MKKWLYLPLFLAVAGWNITPAMAIKQFNEQFTSTYAKDPKNEEFNKLFPEADRLAAMGREFAFHPSATTHPHKLTVEQIEKFNRDGFVSGIRLFSEAEMAEHRRYFDELLARVLASGQDNYSIKSAHLLYGKVYDLLTNARVVDYVKDLLGENVIGWGAHYFLQAAPRRQNRRLASGRRLLAADAFKGRHRMAGD